MIPRLECFDPCRSPAAGDDQRQLQAAIRSFVEGEVSPCCAERDESAGCPRKLFREAA